MTIMQTLNQRTDSMKSRSMVRVNVKARDFSCQGALVVPFPDGYRGRILDLLNEGPDFLALTQVLLFPAGSEKGDDPLEYDTLLIRKNVIDLVVPFD